jgi:antitoxin component of RelBE/YafQ-DinJ toxin-antitoxin module
MTETFRCRVDKQVLRKAHEVSEQTGTSDSELVRIFLKALVKTGRLSFTPRGETEEDEMLGLLERRRVMLDYFHDH